MSDASMSKAEHRSIFGSDIAAVNMAKNYAERLIARGGGTDIPAVQSGQILLIFTEVYEAAHDMVHARTDRDSKRAYLELLRLVKQIEMATISQKPVGFE